MLYLKLKQVTVKHINKLIEVADGQEEHDNWSYTILMVRLFIVSDLPLCDRFCHVFES